MDEKTHSTFWTTTVQFHQHFPNQCILALKNYWKHFYPSIVIRKHSAFGISIENHYEYWELLSPVSNKIHIFPLSSTYSFVELSTFYEWKKYFDFWLQVQANSRWLIFLKHISALRDKDVRIETRKEKFHSAAERVEKISISFSVSSISISTISVMLSRFKNQIGSNGNKMTCRHLEN